MLITMIILDIIIIVLLLVMLIISLWHLLCGEFAQLVSLSFELALVIVVIDYHRLLFIL